METTKLRRFAQYARRTLMELVEARLKLVLQAGSAARRENAEAIKKLEEAIKNQSESQVAERVAYIWFNRFCALRFMDLNRYTRIGVVSPAEGQFQPEILAEAKMGHIDDETVPEKIRLQIFALLEGKLPSHDPQGEAYRLLVVAACNAFHRAMPFLFERIDDYTELLMPDDLLSGNSILAYIREAMTPDACKNPQTEEPIVEVIGWLYQFYISEKKDLVFEGLKKNQKITSENIPAATQLFTPHWIVRYLVENSLGRLWLLNRPGSKLAEQMDYYIKPEQAETEFLRITNPEEIKICDPACGSGHMLTYAFDLLYAIYEEDGVDIAEIPEKILTHNLYGIEIDERAGELAAFALTMKARAKQRRFFNKGIKPNICVLENVKFDEGELKEYMGFVGRDLFAAPLQTTLRQFEEADNFGSLIRPDVTDVGEVLKILESKDVTGHLFLSQTHQKVLQALRQTDYLSPQYHVVIANPPYMGASNANPQLKKLLSMNFPSGKSDLMTAFILRAEELVSKMGLVAAVTLDSWMFLSSYQSFRDYLFKAGSISTLVHVGWNCFPDGHAYNRGVAFVFDDSAHKITGRFVNLSNVDATTDKHRLFLQRLRENYIYQTKTDSFEKLPGQPLAYWMSDAFRRAFETLPSLGKFAEFRIGMATGKNDLYVRLWHEVSRNRTGLGYGNREEAKTSELKWFPYAKGGQFRRWAGNREHLVNWQSDGYALQTTKHPSGERIWAHNFNLNSIFKPAVCWTQVTDAGSSFRFYPDGFLFDAAAGLGQPTSSGKMELMLGLLNSVISEVVQSFLNPTRNILPGTLSAIPAASVDVRAIVSGLVKLAEADWDSNEASWDFTCLPLLSPDYRQSSSKGTYQKLRTHWREMTLEMQRLEQENNRIFIDAYDLQDELTADVPLKEITLTCNPHYRYGGVKTGAELEAQLQADTMAEFLSYAVGCMFGRYSLDKPGLVLANQGDTLAEYLRQVPEPSFIPDEDNVIPLLDGEWFADDVTERFRTFLRVTFGQEHYEENLAFIEKSLGKDVRRYFIKDFYTDHVKRYKKRPIYWLFASPKGTFSALIYLHRYRPDTVSVVLQYLRDFRKKLAARLDYLQQVGISTSASQGEKTRALKEVETLKKQLLELDDYERDTLYPLATEQVALDLDDGVKVNYLKLGPALKKIVGLDAKGDE